MNLFVDLCNNKFEWHRYDKRRQVMTLLRVNETNINSFKNPAYHSQEPSTYALFTVDM
jgi:hypothetical protein